MATYNLAPAGMGDIVYGLTWQGPHGFLPGNPSPGSNESGGNMPVAEVSSMANPTGTGGTAIAAYTTAGGAIPVTPAPPQFTTASMPTMQGTANAVTGNPQGQQPVLTPQWLNQHLPSIVDHTPMVKDSSPCDPVSQWVNDNPLLAGALLLTAGFMVFGRGN
jgi:hypothetical protein